MQYIYIPILIKITYFRLSFDIQRKSNYARKLLENSQNEHILLFSCIIENNRKLTHA